jgi:hypothetical protein
MLPSRMSTTETTDPKGRSVLVTDVNSYQWIVGIATLIACLGIFMPWHATTSFLFLNGAMLTKHTSSDGLRATAGWASGTALLVAYAAYVASRGRRGLLVIAGLGYLAALGGAITGIVFGMSPGPWILLIGAGASLMALCWPAWDLHEVEMAHRHAGSASA